MKKEESDASTVVTSCEWCLCKEMHDSWMTLSGRACDVVCMYIHTYMYIYIHTRIYTCYVIRDSGMAENRHICIIYMYIYIYIYIYIYYIHTYTHTHTDYVPNRCLLSDYKPHAIYADHAYVCLYTCMHWCWQKGGICRLCRLYVCRPIHVYALM